MPPRPPPRTARPARSDGSAPLEGLRVFDLTRVLAGPMVGRLLADLGADVVKLEPPGEDISRYVAPKDDRGMSGLYTMVNVGKRNLSLDLHQAAGREIALGLARWADVVIENFRPGVMDRLGLGWKTLHAEHPKLVLLSINGYGSKSDASGRPAYAPVIHAVTGLLQYHAEWTGHPLSHLADNQADIIASLHGTIGLLSALRSAEATGEGQHVEVPLFDAILSTYSETPFVLHGEPRQECPLYDAGPHGFVAIAGSPQNAWQRMKTTHGLADGAPEGADVPTKASLRRDAIGRWMATQPDLETILSELDRAGLAGGPVEAMRDVLRGPLAKERELLVEVDDRRGGTRGVVRAPYRFAGDTCDIRRPAPRQGEHNREVLSEILDYDDAKIDALVRDGVVVEAKG